MSTVASTQSGQTQFGAGALQYRSAMINIRIGAVVSTVGLGTAITTSYPITGVVVAVGGAVYAGRGILNANRAVDTMAEVAVQLFVIKPICEIGRVVFGIR